MCKFGWDIHRTCKIAKGISCMCKFGWDIHRTCKITKGISGMCKFGWDIHRTCKIIKGISCMCKFGWDIHRTCKITKGISCMYMTWFGGKYCIIIYYCLLYSAIFGNISAISWREILFKHNIFKQGIVGRYITHIKLISDIHKLKVN